MQASEGPSRNLNSSGKLQKFIRIMEPYRRQQRNEKEREPETRGNKAPVGEIRMNSRGLVVGGSSKSL